MSIIGNPLGTPRIRRGWSRQSGFFTIKEWEGQCDSIYGCLGELSGHDSYEIDDRDAPKLRLTVRYSDSQGDSQNESPVDEVHLHANRLEKELWSNPQFSDVVDADRRVIRAVIDNPEKYKLKELAEFGFATESAGILFALLKAGINHSVFFNVILERRRIASATFNFTGTINTAYEHIGAIIAPGSIIADAALPEPRLYTLPAGGSNVIIGDDPPLTFAYGWLKGYPDYSGAAGNKGVVSQEWDFGLWNTNIYGAPI